MVYETVDSKRAAGSKYISKSGTPTLDIYEYKVDKAGVKELVKTDRKENVYERIQADYDATDINKLMLRFSLGDTSVLDKVQPFYGDVTNMPTNYAELFDRVEECKRTFEVLPADLKSEFANSYEQFFSELNNDPKSVYSKFDAYEDRFKDHSFDDKVPGSIPKETEEYTEVER